MDALSSRIGEEARARLAAARVGVAGLGGLGSVSYTHLHELSERVERAIMQRFPNVIEVLVHVEPNDGHED